MHFSLIMEILNIVSSKLLDRAAKCYFTQETSSSWEKVGKTQMKEGILACIGVELSSVCATWAPQVSDADFFLEGL